MKRIFLLLLLMLVPCLAVADPLALRLEHVWFDQAESEFECDPCKNDDIESDNTDFMFSLVASPQISDDLYATGRFSYLFGSEDKQWSIGIEYHFSGFGLTRR